jgi:hypothetical protein
MKPTYWVVIFFLLIAWLIFVIGYFIICRFCMAEPRAVPGTLEAAVQALSAVAAAAAAVSALGLADPPKKEISIQQLGNAYPQTDKGHPRRGHPTDYVKARIHQDYRGPFEQYPDTFHSYRVGFDLTNTSGFLLRKPRLTITVPANRRHPRDLEGGDSEPTCNVLFGPTIEMPSGRLTEDTFAITAKLADDWSREAKMAFWVRMVLDNLPDDPFALDVAVTSDDAEGGACKITIVPNDLIQLAMQP